MLEQTTIIMVNKSQYRPNKDRKEQASENNISLYKNRKEIRIHSNTQ